MEFFGYLIIFTIAILSIETSGKTLHTDKSSLDVENNNLAEKSENHRVGRQNIRVLGIAEDYEDLGVNRNRPPIFNTPTTIPSLIPKRNRGPGRIFGFMRSLFRTSIGRQNETFGRVRREVEEFVDKMIKNDTKSQRQEEEDKSDEIKSSEEDKSDGSNSSEEDEPPGGGDGMGGGILGVLAGLSGGDGESDLGSLLAAVGGIIGQLSGGDDFDLNALIDSAVAVLGGILAGDGKKPIGTQIGTYLITAFEGLTGGGATNNGKFIGDFLNTLAKGSIAADVEDTEEIESSERGTDSGSFFLSLLSGLFGGSRT